MIRVEEAQALVRKHVRVGPIVNCVLKDSLGLVLAQQITAKLPSPPFDASSVDGYAVSLKSFNTFIPGGSILLPVVGEIQPGDSLGTRANPKATLRIFTGARVPKGTDAIVMQEEVTQEKGLIRFSQMPIVGANIRPKGGEHPRGRKIFEAGVLITPSVLGALAALGYSHVKVHRSPHIAIVVTGNELRPPGSKLKGSEIWDANGFALVAAHRSLGFKNIQVFRSRDTLKSVENSLTKAIAISDVVIVSGGISVGDHDHVKAALENLGGKQIFWRVRVKPGMPIYFGKISKPRRGESKYIFALPGNPVSALVTFQLFVRDALLQLIGTRREEPLITATLTQAVRKSHGRREYVRGKYSTLMDGTLEVSPIEARESHMMSGLAQANCLIEVQEDEKLLSEGSRVRILPLHWSIFA